jgi:hypothetical protein
MRNIIKNKRGFSLGSWLETSLFCTLFVVLLVSLFSLMNANYSRNVEGLDSLNSLATATQANLTDYQSTLQQSVNDAQSSSTGLGISLSTTWNIIKTGSTMLWSFLTGGWVSQLVQLIGLPAIVGTILQILYVISIGLIILRLVLKINA